MTKNSLPGIFWRKNLNAMWLRSISHNKLLLLLCMTTVSTLVNQDRWIPQASLVFQARSKSQTWVVVLYAKSEKKVPEQIIYIYRKKEISQWLKIFLKKIFSPDKAFYVCQKSIILSSQTMNLHVFKLLVHTVWIESFFKDRWGLPFRIISTTINCSSNFLPL